MDKRPTHKDLSGKINQAKAAVKAGRIALVDQTVIVADLLDLGHEISALPKILLDLLEQVTPGSYAGTMPPQRSYKSRIAGSELYAFKCVSKRMGCTVYIKFTLKHDFLWLVSIHEDRQGR
jgi:hypothetical protein